MPGYICSYPVYEYKGWTFELTELREAVRWERGCRYVRNKMRLWHIWPAQDEAQASYLAARAAVDALVGGENG